MRKRVRRTESRAKTMPPVFPDAPTDIEDFNDLCSDCDARQVTREISQLSERAFHRAWDRDGFDDDRN